MDYLSKREYEKAIAATRDDRMKWWRDARFGMFVHYASYNLRQQIFQHSRFTDIAPYDSNMTKMDKSKLNFNRL